MPADTVKPLLAAGIQVGLCSLLAISGVAVTAAAAVEPSAVPDLALSFDGAYVISLRARAAWPRCVEGMRWDGTTCSGTPTLLDQAGAAALARNRAHSDHLDWRLPTVTELQWLVAHDGSGRGLDPTLFPSAPQGWYWSATANVTSQEVNPYAYANVMRARNGEAAATDGFLRGWAVNLSTREARGNVDKRIRLPVRLTLQLD